MYKSILQQNNSGKITVIFSKAWKKKKKGVTPKRSSTRGNLKRIMLWEVVDDFQGFVVQLEIWKEIRRTSYRHPIQPYLIWNSESPQFSVRLPKAIPLSSLSMVYAVTITAPLLDTMPMTSTIPLSSSSSWRRHKRQHVPSYRGMTIAKSTNGPSFN